MKVNTSIDYSQVGTRWSRRMCRGALYHGLKYIRRIRYEYEASCET
jgi:hypothetical protein